MKKAAVKSNRKPLPLVTGKLLGNVCRWPNPTKQGSFQMQEAENFAACRTPLSSQRTKLETIFTYSSFLLIGTLLNNY